MNLFSFDHQLRQISRAFLNNGSVEKVGQLRVAEVVKTTVRKRSLIFLYFSVKLLKAGSRASCFKQVQRRKLQCALAPYMLVKVLSSSLSKQIRVHRLKAATAPYIKVRVFVCKFPSVFGRKLFLLHAILLTECTLVYWMENHHFLFCFTSGLYSILFLVSLAVLLLKMCYILPFLI